MRAVDQNLINYCQLPLCYIKNDSDVGPVEFKKLFFHTDLLLLLFGKNFFICEISTKIVETL